MKVSIWILNIYWYYYSWGIAYFFRVFNKYVIFLALLRLQWWWLSFGRRFVWMETLVGHMRKNRRQGIVDWMRVCISSHSDDIFPWLNCQFDVNICQCWGVSVSYDRIPIQYISVSMKNEPSVQNLEIFMKFKPHLKLRALSKSKLPEKWKMTAASHFTCNR